MSAIFGIFNLEKKPIDPAWIKSMQEDLAHRGPDGMGLYKEESLVLGHCLLQVTPESVYDKSPFEEDGFVITANARLDERESLMDRLDMETEEREKTTDSMLLLRSYRKWGKVFVKDIYGDFSFAIWDKEKREIFCARDHMGIKPFLYYFQDNYFVFSTELKSIVKLALVQTEIDQIHLRNKCIGAGNNPVSTSWKNIVRLSGANTLSFSPAGIIITQYWKPAYKRDKTIKTEEQSAEELRRILEKVIADHTRSIGGIGVPLSGGLDSSTIACLAARKMAAEGKQLITASSVLHPEFSEPAIKDEMEYIQTVLQQEKNIEATFIYNTDFEFITNLEDKFNRHFTTVNYFYYVDEGLYKQFSNKSVHRVLSGFLGDLTTSNRIIYPLPILLLTGRIASFFNYCRIIQKKSGSNWQTFIKFNILKPVMPLFLLKLRYKLKGRIAPWNIDNLPLIVSNDEKKELERKKLTRYGKQFSYSSNITKYIWPAPWEPIEEDWDCGCSHYKLEMTYPLLDRRVVEFLMRIPVEHFYSNGQKRGLIRNAMQAILPEKIRERKDKNSYSPGYHQVAQKYLSEINLLLKNVKLTNRMANTINTDKMNIQLENLVKSKSSANFVTNYWYILNISLWIAFVNWLVIKKSKRNL
jgi:asparagine synthase (glutamine-hydrolysing)